MAEAFLQVLVENLNSLIKGEIRMILGVDDEMKKLASTLTTIQAVLEDAEDKQVESKSIRNWLRKLNELAFEIEDIVDEVSILQHKNSSKWSRCSLKKIVSRHKIGKRMKEVSRQLDAVAADREKFHLREMDVGRHNKLSATRETVSILNEPDRVYGRDDERDKIVDILVNRDCERLSVLPIIGIGGLGKTTLAQLVYNDPRVSKHFEPKLWVYVSDNFDVKTLVKAIIKSAKGSVDDSDPLEVLESRLSDLLNHKRYLLILDDVWNEDQEKWAMLRNALARGRRGASVVVTTRLKNVADIMGTLPAHSLEGLPEEHCWLLFKQRAFGHETEEYRNLEPIGREIVKKCGGVPLAAKALGGLLRQTRNEKEWLHIKESEIWNLEDETLLPALRLSYHHLPSWLRQCFAYCSVFPKGSEIKKEELIFLWIAHNCISLNGRREVEDVGDKVLDELVSRSLLQATTSIFGRNIFKMHDLVHDLAQSIMENKLPGAEAKEKGDRSVLINNRIRHVDLVRRSLAFPTSFQNEADICFTLVNFNRLRMLNASFMGINELPSAIGNMKHLRSLDLSHNKFRSLPNSVCRLWNLKIFNLNSCRELVDLPKDMRYMCNLRHMFLDECPSLSKMPCKIGEMSSLKTLSVFIVDHERGYQLGELHRLNLGGKLEIWNLERVKNHMDAGKANLVDKPNLRDLLLKWEAGEGASSSRENMDEKVIEALVPPRSLETLMISGYKGTFLPHWMRTIENLVRIKMEGCSNCSHISSLGNLPRLKFLRLEDLTSLEYVSEDDVRSGPPAVKTKFQSLENLELVSLPNLKRLFKEEMGEILPNLWSLRVYGCYMLMLPPLSSLKELGGTCSQLNLKSFSKLDNLTSLDLWIVENIPKEAFENLHNLEKLVLRNAHDECLESEGLRCLKSLKELKLVRCLQMRCLPDAWLRHLTALETLELNWCPELVELPEGIKFLHSLKHLQLFFLDGMISLPEVIQQIPSLQTLDIRLLYQLTSLPDWLGNITSLEGLTIFECKRLASLPAGIQGMTNLKTLRIVCCSPELERRCEKEKGEDWHKIAHIDQVDIY